MDGLHSALHLLEEVQEKELDVFYYSPTFGSGPGNLENMMLADKYL